MGEANHVPARIRLSRERGWRMPPGTKKVDRTTWFGNPFRVDEHGTRAECVAMFEALITGQRAPDNAHQSHRAAFVRGNLPMLRGYPLACWCPLDEPCHADVLLKLANEAIRNSVLMCLGCGRELPPRDTREIIRELIGTHGPFCDACTPPEDMPFDQWLDEQWQRQNAH